MVPIRAVSFDVFGTLLNYDIWRAELAYITKLVDARKLKVNPERFLRHWLERSLAYRQEGYAFRTVRESLVVAVDEILTRAGSLDDPKEWTERLLDFWRSRPLFADAMPALRALAEHGIRVGFVSNCDRDVLDAILKNTGLAALGHPSVASQDVGAYKPSPRLFTALLKKVAAGPKETLHCGDSITEDVGGAQAVGLRTCWVNREDKPTRTGAPLPDIMARDLRGIPEWIAAGAVSIGGRAKADESS